MVVFSSKKCLKIEIGLNQGWTKKKHRHSALIVLIKTEENSNKNENNELKNEWWNLKAQ